MTKDKNKKMKELNSLLEKVTTIDLERKKLEEKLLNLLPIREGDKIEIIHAETDAHIRFAFVSRIRIGEAHEKRGAEFHFDFHKCKKDGSKSNHADSLRYMEQVRRIK